MRIRSSALALTLFLSSICLAAPAAPDKKTPAPRPPPNGVKVERDILYVPNGDPDSQILDIYFPELPGEKPQPLLVWIHGGGWVGGSKASCAYINQVKRGYIVASVENRFSQKAIFPAQAQDCQAAIRWLRANAKKYNIDPEHVGVGGDSAGGHLAALVGTSGEKKKPSRPSAATKTNPTASKPSKTGMGRRISIPSSSRPMKTNSSRAATTGTRATLIPR